MKKSHELASHLGYLLMDGADVDSDTLGVALVEYFERHPDRPEDDEADGDTGWGVWALDRARDVLVRLADSALSFGKGRR